MEKIKLFIILNLFVISTYAKDLMIISDLDDTIKITQVQSRGRMVWNGLFTRKVFAGTSELFNLMQKYVNKTYVLTSSPSILNYNINKLFKKYEIEVNGLITRDIFKDRDSKLYKINAIENLIENNPGTSLIFMGDNTGEDHHIYESIKEKYPHIVEEIYMHKVTTNKIPSKQKVWFSMVDVAYYEYLANRLNESEFFTIYNSVYNSKVRNIIPKKLYCPKTIKEWKKIPTNELYFYVKKVASKIIRFCEKNS